MLIYKTINNINNIGYSETSCWQIKIQGQRYNSLDPVFIDESVPTFDCFKIS